jgi:hypothetical protein
MRRLNTSHAALAISIASLFVALGGTALAVTQIGTSQIKNGAVTTSKLHAKAVTNGKLGANSVGTGKIKNGAVTAAKVAPNTFLPINGTAANATNAVNATNAATAANASRLGGLLPGDYLQGLGATTVRRLVVPVNVTLDLFNAGFGGFVATCSATDQPSVTWTPTVSDAEYSVQSLVYPNTVLLTQLNGIAAGSSDTEPNPLSALPMTLQYSIGYTAAGVDHVATAYISGRFEFGTGCVFVAQETSTG